MAIALAASQPAVKVVMRDSNSLEKNYEWPGVTEAAAQKLYGVGVTKV